MASSRVPGAAVACVMVLSLAAGHRKWYWSGCIAVAVVICRQGFLSLKACSVLKSSLCKSLLCVKAFSQ